jgi:8-oxo-dGTP pyrophosphatase MutT (NUDIX family)
VFESSYKIRISSRAIIIHKDKILLNEFDKGKYYNFIGGGIEEKETAKQAVVREVLEESGLSVDVGDLVFSLEYEPKSCNYLYGEGHHISFFFRCYLNENFPGTKVSLPDVNPHDSSMVSIAKWINISKLNDINLVPNIHKSLIEYIETGIFNPLFWSECDHIV